MQIHGNVYSLEHVKSHKLTLCHPGSVTVGAELKVFGQAIKREKRLTASMRHAAPKLEAGESKNWDASLLSFLLLNSSHNLLPADTMADERKLVEQLCSKRNVGYGHATQFSKSPEEYEELEALVLQLTCRCLPGLTTEINNLLRSIAAEGTQNVGTVEAQTEKLKMLAQRMPSGVIGLEHHHNAQGQGIKRPHSDTTQ